jgi:hydroxyacylglutathione hydrolase
VIDVGSLAIHRIVSEPLAENCYVVSSVTGDAVVLDPGGEAEGIASHVAANGLCPHAVLNTHGHYDHVGAAAEIVGRYSVPFAIHSADTVALRRANFCRFAFHGLGRVDIPDIGLDLASVSELAFGDLEIAVIHAPGHSPGSVCLEIAGALFTGDTLMTKPVPHPDIPGYDPATLDASVRRLAGAYGSDTVIYPGHGEPGLLGDAVQLRAPVI